VAALRFVPLPAHVRPEDRHYVEVPTVASSPGTGKKTADEKADQSRKRLQRTVWVKEGELLRAIPVTLGLIDNQFAELVEAGLSEGQELVIALDTGTPSR